MNVLHLVAGDLKAGAARGAYWLHQGLLQLNVNSRILTNSRDTLSDDHVDTVNVTFLDRVRNSFRNRIDQLPVKMYPRRNTQAFSTSLTGYDFRKHPSYKWADILHLHWINGGFVNIAHLENIEKPIVWTLRDMWPLTGGCHVAMDCMKYTAGCGACPQLGSQAQRDLSSAIITRKKKVFPSSINIVGISEWISGCARDSEVFRNFRVLTIPNNINCEEFFPVDKEKCRNELGLPKDKKIVLIGAQHAHLPWKGFQYFSKADGLLESDDFHIVLFGTIDSKMLAQLKHSYTELGVLHGNDQLRQAYAAADVFVAPSVMESFGKTLAESMACKTPVVCFDATGPKDIVDHLTNGYRAKAFDAADLAAGIRWTLSHPDIESVRERARKKIVDEFDTPVIASRYTNLYAELLRS